MTDLKTYLAETGEKQSSFANRVQTTSATVSRLCKGTLRPALDLAHRIEKATDGLVPMEAWLPTGAGSDEADEHTRPETLEQASP